jgi:hypothetical protein
MVHKIYDNVKYDEDGDVLMESLNAKQKKFFELKEFYKYTPDKLFTRAFDACWSEHGMDFEPLDLDEKLDPLLEQESMRELKAKAGI